ncbi:MAG: META domain-containing protein [Coleofasciculaceae cyanobacterium SM2_1_6]|nr:META domain-containing protein [Coleofasciculaceae cyanobacterium SM2_1_6]
MNKKISFALITLLLTGSGIFAAKVNSSEQFITSFGLTQEKPNLPLSAGVVSNSAVFRGSLPRSQRANPPSNFQVSTQTLHSQIPNQVSPPDSNQLISETLFGKTWVLQTLASEGRYPLAGSTIGLQFSLNPEPPMKDADTPEAPDRDPSSNSSETLPSSVSPTLEGRVSGRGGCNHYNSSFTLQGDRLTILPGVTTRMFCQQPEGVMGQESYYLAKLTTVASYRIQDGSLTLLDAEGKTIALFITR